MHDLEQVHLHWKDLLSAMFPAERRTRTLFPNDRLRVLMRLDLHNAERPCLSHDHDYFEVAVVRSGRAKHSSLYGTKTMGPGDVLILPPRIWHRYTASQDLELYNCCIGYEVIQQQLAFLASDPFWGSFLAPASIARQSQWQGNFRIPSDRFKAVEASFRLLLELTHRPFEFQTNYQLLGALIVTFGQLADALRGQARLAAAPPTLHPLIQKALMLVEQNVDRDWRIDDLCAELNGLNEAYFIRLFKQNIGMTPKAYITRRRVEKAANRLITTDESMTEIALSLGWNDPNLFSRTFRKFFGASPSEYRAARRQ